jgi:UDP-GlcNAc:undecaprenyl-phosphate/decaprenyl-phosphate GlcNAc-1-phosphate transferase
MFFGVKYIVVFALSLMASLCLTPLVKRIAPKLGLLDIPSGRRIHIAAIPRCGGIAVFLATHLALMMVFFGPWREMAGSVQVEEWMKILIGSSLLFALGLWDDRFMISAKVKLAGQLGVASLMFFFGFSFESLLGFSVPWGINYAATLFWFTLLINAFNLVDGMDGACAGLGTVSGMTMVVLLLFLRQPTDALVVTALVGACLGFLRYNFHPATVFLGDCGSMFIGFMLASVSIKAHVNQSLLVALLVPLLAVGVPVFDVIMAVWRRVARKLFGVINQDGSNAKVFGPDMDHVHHKLLNSGLSQKKAAIALYVAATFVCIVALSSVMMTNHRTAILLLGTVVIIHVVVRQFAHVELWTSAQVLLHGFRRPRAAVRFFMHVLLDLFILGGSALLVYRILFPIEMPLAFISMFVWIPLLVMYVFKVYQTIWARSRPIQFVILGCIVLTGQVLAFVAVLLVSDYSVRELLFAQLILFETVLIAIICSRAFPRILSDLVAWIPRNKFTPGSRRTLLVGAGSDSALYLGMESQLDERWKNRSIVGLVDDSESFQGKYIFGYPVLGSFSQLRSLIGEYQVSEIIVCRELTKSENQQMMSLKSTMGISLQSFSGWLRDVSSYEQEATTDESVLLRADEVEPSPAVSEIVWGKEIVESLFDTH